MDDTEEGYEQGTWEHIRPAPKKAKGREDGKGPRDFIDEAALGRLVKKYGRPDGTIDARPRPKRRRRLKATQDDA
jgi:hypothetical protein